MKRFLVISLLTLFALSCTLSAFAVSASCSGSTSGGSAGTTSCSGLLVGNDSSSAGNDSAYADTHALKSGKLTATCSIAYGGQYTNSKSRNGNGTGITSPTAYVPSGYHATRANGSHKFSSDDYGSWAKSTRVKFTLGN